ncbi:phenylalanine--tRNA ligase subunit alpha, partial [Candidatus Microgenomates bacterium]|nr:phenylalanine--tRNA ligase subunit alpha [Candidatus Microgenomates bacterium]
MEKELNELYLQAREQIIKQENLTSLNNLWLFYFGSNGKATLLLRKLKDIPKDERPKIGKLVNQIKNDLELLFKEQKNKINKKFTDEWLDVTSPGIRPQIGHLHPQTIVLHDLIEIFKEIGFQVADGPEIETDWYNFGSLNFPKDHPARDTQQSLHIETRGKYLPGEIILRTQTSA